MRFSIPHLTVIATLAATSLCEAGGLYGSNSTPYAAGYAPVAAPAAPTTVVATQTNTFAPANGSYSAGYAPYASGYRQATTPYLGVAPTSAPTAVAPIASNGAYQAQRPSYVDNPSVYTGLPVSGNVQSAYRTPLSSAPAFPSVTYQAGYAAAYPGAVTPTQPVPVGATTGIPAAAVVAPATPVYPSTPPPSGGCLSRFCQRLFGTSYTTSYYRAPVTYYRPVTTLNPATGTAVTVQQPCMAYEQQVQRTPFTNFQPAPLTAPRSNCGTSNCGPSAADSCNVAPYNQPAFGTPTPFGSTPSSGVGQVNAISPGDNQTVPIPSIPPSGQSYPQAGSPNLSPLAGAPPTLAPPSFAPAQPASPPTSAPYGSPPIAPPNGVGDMSPVDKPSLNKAPTDNTSTDAPEKPSDRPPSYWQLQNAEDSTAMIPRHPAQPTQTDPASLSSGYGTAQPIRAPDDYVAPFGRPQTPANAATAPVAPPPTTNLQQPGSPNATPNLPPPGYDPSDLTSVSHRQPGQARDAYSQFRSSPAPSASRPSSQPRDTTWISINP